MWRVPKGDLLTWIRAGKADVSANSIFFFFQAEDGIRDADVTGVQTCALPISGALAYSPRRPLRTTRRVREGARDTDHRQGRHEREQERPAAPEVDVVEQARNGRDRKSVV